VETGHHRLDLGALLAERAQRFMSRAASSCASSPSISSSRFASWASLLCIEVSSGCGRNGRVQRPWARAGVAPMRRTHS
jgi:hypothetical protein